MKRSRCAGFTLFEMVLVVALVAVVAGLSIELVRITLQVDQSIASVQTEAMRFDRRAASAAA